MLVNIREFLDHADVQDSLYPGKRIVKPCKQIGQYKNHCVVIDWRDPDTIEIDVRPGLSGKLLEPAVVKQYPVCFQMPTNVKIKIANDEDEDDESEGKGSKGKGGSGGKQPAKKKLEDIEVIAARFGDSAEGKIPVLGEIVEMVVMGVEIAKEAFANAFSELTNQMQHAKISATEILSKAADLVTRVQPPSFMKPKGDETANYKYDREKNANIGFRMSFNQRPHPKHLPIYRQGRTTRPFLLWFSLSAVSNIVIVGIYNHGYFQAMSNKDDNQNKQENVIRFPEGNERKAFAKRKEREEKESDKERKEREKIEEEYREQYRKERAARARLQSKVAQTSAAGKQPFINWDRVPPFTRFMILIFLVVHIASAFLLDDVERYNLALHFGFIPAYYTGGLPWTWTALIAPFTTLFMHGGWMHLLINSVMMVAMGVFFERQFGAKRTFIFFLACGMAGNLVYFLINPTLTTPVIGASGAISGLFGATMMMMTASGLAGPEAQRRGPMPFILLWISIIVMTGVFSADTAWQSHLGGFLGGIGFYQLWRKGYIKF